MLNESEGNDTGRLMLMRTLEEVWKELSLEEQQYYKRLLASEEKFRRAAYESRNEPVICEDNKKRHKEIVCALKEFYLTNGILGSLE